MKRSVRKGLGFGLTSGVITTLGVLVGLNSSTHSRLVVVGGIILVAVADALSDSLGIHISEEFSLKKKELVWQATIVTFFAKFITALTFIVPFLFLDLFPAIILCIVWGLLLITVFSYKMSKQRNSKPHKAIIEHLGIAILVIVITFYLGKLIAIVFS